MLKDYKIFCRTVGVDQFDGDLDPPYPNEEYLELYKLFDISKINFKDDSFLAQNSNLIKIWTHILIFVETGFCFLNHSLRKECSLSAK